MLVTYDNIFLNDELIQGPYVTKVLKKKLKNFFGRDIYSANKRDMSTQKSSWALERLNLVYIRGIYGGQMSEDFYPGEKIADI